MRVFKVLLLSYAVMLSFSIESRIECAKYSTPTDVPSYGVQIRRACAYGGGKDGGGRGQRREEHGRNKFSACRDRDGERERGTFAGLKYGPGRPPSRVPPTADPPRIMIFGFRPLPHAHRRPRTTEAVTAAEKTNRARAYGR